MAKRFTDSRKWDDPWFIDLDNDSRMLWIYLLDKCSHSGIYKRSDKLKTFYVGDVSFDDFFEQSDSRLIDIGNGKYFIPKFIEFQYGVSIDSLNENNRVHKSVIDELNKEGVLKGLRRGLIGLKDKDKDNIKDKDKDKDKNQDNNIDSQLYVKMNCLIAQGCKDLVDIKLNLDNSYSEHDINEAWEHVQWYKNKEKKNGQN